MASKATALLIVVSPAASMSALQPLNVYRKLLRAAGSAFKGDTGMLAAAQAEIRGKFEEARAVSDPGQREQLLAEGSETADFIRSSIVQAAANERGAFEVKIGEQHLGGLVEEVTPDMKLPRVKKQK